jgi:hypothetical protein
MIWLGQVSPHHRDESSDTTVMGVQIPVIVDLFHTTHHAKTRQVTRSQQCGDIELAEYLTNATGSVSLVSDLRIPHDRFWK